MEDIKIEKIDGLTKILNGSPACADREERTIYIDSGLEKDFERLCVIHEILEIWLGGRIKHSNIDRIAIDIISCLREIGELK